MVASPHCPRAPGLSPKDRSPQLLLCSQGSLRAELPTQPSTKGPGQGRETQGQVQPWPPSLEEGQASHPLTCLESHASDRWPFLPSGLSSPWVPAPDPSNLSYRDRPTMVGSGLDHLARQQVGRFPPKVRPTPAPSPHVEHSLAPRHPHPATASKLHPRPHPGLPLVQTDGNKPGRARQWTGRKDVQGRRDQGAFWEAEAEGGQTHFTRSVLFPFPGR